MKKFVVILGGLAVVILGGAVALPHLIDWNKYKPEIQKAVADVTGYDVSLAGPIELAVLPFPRVVLESVSVKVPGGKADIVGLKKAEISVALLPLFSGRLSVSSVNLVDPVINLVVDKDGNQLWMTETLKNKKDANAVTEPTPATGPKPGADDSFALNKLDIENGTLNYTDAAGKTTSVEKINTTLSADTLAGPFKLRGDVLWNKQKVEADIQTGKIDKTANTVSVQAALKLPESDASVTYAGVVGTAGGIDLQGETQIQSKNISATLSALSGTPSALPPVGLNIQGLLTARDTQADIKNFKFAFGDMQATGSAGAQNLKAQDGPMVVTMDLASASPLKIEDLMPVKSVKSVKGVADKDVPKTGVIKSFLPDSMTLPMAIDVKANIKLAGLSYKGADFGAMTLTLDKKDNVITATENIAKIPGGGTLTGKTTVNFASGSQGAGKSGVVYSDPGINFDIKLDSKSPANLLAAFLPDATVKTLPPVLKEPLALNASGNVRGTKVGIEAGTLTLGETIFNLGSSSYVLDQTGKNDVLLTVSGQNINLDSLIGTKPVPAAATDGKDQAAAPEAKQAFQDTLKKIELPVDLIIKADLKNVTMQGTTYAALNIDGALKGNNLSLKTASMQDSQGNVMQAAGLVKDIHTLGGVDITLSGKTSDANAFLKSLKVDTAKLPKNIGPLDLSVTLTGEKPESLAFNAKAKVFEGDGEANGIVVNALGSKPAVDKVAIHISNPNFEHLMQKFSPTYKAGVGINKNMDVKATINLAGDAYDVSGLNATIGSMTMTGTIKAKTGGAKPDITAVLNATTMPLDILAGKDRSAPATSPGTSKTINAPTGSERWSREPINAAMFNSFNLDLKLNAKSVQYGSWVLDNTVFAVTLKDGTLKVDQMDADVYGGKMGLTATAKAGAKEGNPISFETKSNFKNVDLEPLAASFSGGTKLIKARGDVSVTLEAKSSGASPSALVSGLSGSGQIDGKDVVLQGFDLAAMSRSLVSTTKVFDNIAGLAGASFKGGETAFQKIDGPFTISQGVISFDKFLMEGQTATITNKGTISLPRWYVDMASSIDLAQPEDAPNLDMKFQGSLDNPGNTFAGNAMQSYIQSRLNKKLQNIVTDKLGDKNPALNNLVNGLLGGGKPVAAPVPAAAPTPAPSAAPAAAQVKPAAAPAPVPEAVPDEHEAAPEAVAPAPAVEPEKEQSREEKINNVLQGILGQ